ncbi:MAG: hypothetical protein ACO1O1_06035 [Adhaeribacter sp.]
MNQEQDQLATLQEIRNIMERSTRFISLSGLSGIVAGIVALCGVAAVKWHFHSHPLLYRDDYSVRLDWDTVFFLLAVAALVVVLAIGAAWFFTARKAKKNNQRMWDAQSRRLVGNVAVPLAVGGLFCGVLLYHGIIYLMAPAMLIFYGLALINGSKYTLSDIRYLGFCEIVLGLGASFFIGYGLLAWALGFGVLHIVYGTLMYFKYERGR